jgi:flagellin
MKELAVQSASGTYSDTDRAALDLEFQQLMSEMDRIARNTEWNGYKILAGNGNFTAGGAAAEDYDIQVGSGSGQTMRVTLKSWVPEVAWRDDNPNNAQTMADITKTDTTALAAKSAYGTAVLAYNKDGDGNQDPIATAANPQDAFIDIKSDTGSAAVIAQIETAITAAAAERATYGAYINRLEYASDNLMNVAQNTDASRSRIEDADYAAETSELARTQIIAQASTAMLAQANQSKQSVLALLQ